jgi:hypothetical protein
MNTRLNEHKRALKWSQPMKEKESIFVNRKKSANYEKKES